MALEAEDYKWLDQKFTNQSEELEKTVKRIVLDYKERDMVMTQRISQLEQAEKHSSHRVTVIEAKADATGALAGKKEGVKWSVIVGLALNLAVQVIERLL